MYRISLMSSLCATPPVVMAVAAELPGQGDLFVDDGPAGCESQVRRGGTWPVNMGMDMPTLRRFWDVKFYLAVRRKAIWDPAPFPNSEVYS